MTLVRNPHWSQGTDDIRHPLVNQVDLTVDSDLSDIDQKLRGGTRRRARRRGVQTAFLSGRS